MIMIPEILSGLVLAALFSNDINWTKKSAQTIYCVTPWLVPFLDGILEVIIAFFIPLNLPQYPSKRLAFQKFGLHWLPIHLLIVWECLASNRFADPISDSLGVPWTKHLTLADPRLAANRYAKILPNSVQCEPTWQLLIVNQISHNGFSKFWDFLTPWKNSDLGDFGSVRKLPESTILMIIFIIKLHLGYKIHPLEMRSLHVLQL